MLLTSRRAISLTLAAIAVTIGSAWAATDGGGNDAKPVVPAGRPTQGAAPSAKPQKWAILIGVNDYLDVSIPDLRFSVADACALREALVDPASGGYAPANVLLLMDGAEDEGLRPTRLNVLGKLANWLQLAGPDDTVLVYFSGHGMEEDGRGYLLPCDARVGILQDSALPLDRVNELLDRAPGKAKVVVLDACHSSAGKQPLPRMSPGFAKALLTESSGRVVFASCRPDQQSYEWPEKGHSVFTHYFIAGITGEADANADGVVVTSELNAFVYDRVRRWAAARGLQQEPTVKMAVTGEIAICGGAGPASTGGIRISSTPDGARIYVDGANRGAAPATVANLPAGEHQLILLHPGRADHRETVHVVAHQTAVVAAVMRSDFGSIKVLSEPPGATVYVDGVERGVTGTDPVGVEGLGVGEHEIWLRRERYLDYRSTVSVKAGGSEALSLTLLAKQAVADSRSDQERWGGIMVSANAPGAEVYVGDVWAGVCPARVTGIEPGSQTLRIMAYGYQTFETTVRVEPGKVASVNAALAREQMAAAGVSFAGPNRPVIVARGESIHLRVQAHSSDLVGGVQVLASVHHRPRAQVRASAPQHTETFAVSIGSDELQVRDYLFRAEAFTPRGKTINCSELRRVSVVEYPPLWVLQPAGGAALRGVTAITGQCRHDFDAAWVAVYVDEVLRGVRKGGSFAVPWDAPCEPPGQHTVRVSACDSQGRVYTAPPIPVTVPERVSVRGVDANKMLVVSPHASGVELSVQLNADDDVNGVEYLIDGRPIVTAAAPPFSAQWDAGGIEDGLHALSARALLADGRAYQSSRVAFSSFNYIVVPQVARVAISELESEDRLYDPYLRNDQRDGVQRRWALQGRAVLAARIGALMLKLAVTLMSRPESAESPHEVRTLLERVVSANGSGSELGRIALGLLVNGGASRLVAPSSGWPSGQPPGASTPGARSGPRIPANMPALPGMP